MKIDREKHSGKVNVTPSGFQLIWQQLKKDQMAMGSFLIFIAILLFVYGSAFVLDVNEITKVNFLAIHQPPSAEYWLRY